ncbi:MAG: glycosyltransferase [Geminicoccaceae bacterium]
MPVTSTGRLLNVHRYRYRKGGAEAVYLDHSRLFVERGWSCAEFAMAHPKNPPSPWDEHFPSQFDPRPGWQGLLDIPRFIYSREAKRQMGRVLETFRPDIVHVHGLYHQLTPSVLEPIAAAGIPIVYTLHDFKLLCPAYSFFTEKLGVCERCASGSYWNCAVHACLHDSRAVSAVYALDAYVHRWRGAYHGVSAFVMPSRSILEKHLEHGFPAEKLHHIPNFFETTADEPVTPELIAEAQGCYGRYVVYFGRLSPEKGCGVLIEACDAAGLTLVLVGEGPEEARLREQAARSSQAVHFTGYLSGERLWAVVEAALGVVLPSIWYEIAPRACSRPWRAKPMVASAIGGLPEQIEDGVTGYLAPPGDAAALSLALLRLAMLSAAEREAMGERARIRALTSFTAERYFSSTAALYGSFGRTAGQGGARSTRDAASRPGRRNA